MRNTHNWMANPHNQMANTHNWMTNTLNWMANTHNWMANTHNWMTNTHQWMTNTHYRMTNTHQWMTNTWYRMTNTGNSIFDMKTASYAMCPNLKSKNNESFVDLPRVDPWEVRSSSAPEWTRQAWMELCCAINVLYFCFMLDGCLYFSISAYAALTVKWTSRDVDTTKPTLAFVTMSHKL